MSKPFGSREVLYVLIAGHPSASTTGRAELMQARSTKRLEPAEGYRSALPRPDVDQSFRFSPNAGGTSHLLETGEPNSDDAREDVGKEHQGCYWTNGN